MTTEEIVNNTQAIAGLGIKKGLSTVEQLILLGGGKLQPFRPARDQAIMNMLEGRDIFEEPTEDMPKTLYGYASYLNNKANPDKEENISIGIPQLNNENTKQKTNVIKENWDRNGNIYYTSETGDNVSPENKLSPTERLERVVESRMANLKRRIEETNFNSPFYKDKVSAISGVLGGTAGIGKSATAQIAERLLPFTGRKIGQMTSQGISSGIGAGAFEGFVEGVYENKNPLINSAQHALAGGAIGGALGYAGGSIGKFQRNKTLSNFVINGRRDKYNLKQYGKRYYLDYIQGQNIDSEIGKINFNSIGVREDWKHNPIVMLNYPKLLNNIKNAKFIHSEQPIHYHKNIKIFHKLDDMNNKYYIGETNNNKLLYYKTINSNNKKAPEGIPAKTNATGAKNIIPNIFSKFNPQDLISLMKQIFNKRK